MAWIDCVSRDMWREPEDPVAWIECVSREMWREPEDRVALYRVCQSLNVEGAR